MKIIQRVYFVYVLAYLFKGLLKLFQYFYALYKTEYCLIYLRGSIISQ